tara:strand:+ start:1335 stop:1679 length:345 start_codon:yes stop_codon:yes gene_type:complete
MSIQPGTYNFIMQRRADFSLRLQFKDSTGANINLAGFTVYSQCWDLDRKIKFADFSVAYTNRTTGTVDISLTDTQTETFQTEKLAYDVLLEDSNNKREYYLEGVITMSEGYTKP